MVLIVGPQYLLSLFEGASLAGGQEAMGASNDNKLQPLRLRRSCEPAIYMAVTFYAGALCLLHITLPLPPLKPYGE